MKVKLKSFVLIMVITAGAFAFVTKPSLLVLGATYVEGRIVQDTVWTLTDSSFVVVKDVIVESSATLTIEPGVDVMFGGNFSLVVEGVLYAKGAEEKPITFTSNKHQPEAGDWNTIKFNGTQPSTLEHCVVEYAVNGITIENGKVLINRGEISHSLQNGVYMVGDNDATISENRIETNLNGIFVAGNSSGATIKQNQVYFNSQKGICLSTDETTHINNVLVLKNSLSTNPVGIYIHGRVNADITRNSIAYNDLGILYESATNILPLHYNDIYGNTLGARALSSDSVDAEYNYWGDESGPYHASLNPSGGGNPVESNGVDLDFIPFLTINNSYINQPPVARVLADKLSVAPNDDVTFIGATSSDDRQVYQYFFDFGDGRNSSWTTLSIFMHEYDSVGTYDATLIVMDDFGVISSDPAEVTINVQDLTPLNVYITLSDCTIGYGGSVSITVQVTDGTSAVEGADITLISVKGGTFQPLSGLTNSTGYFTANFTAPNVTQVTNIRLIATASKDGYADGSDYEYLQVLPPLLVQITAEPDTIKSGEAANVTVHVTYSGQPVSDSNVRVSSDIDGNFSETSGITDTNGFVTFVFTAPQTSILPNVTITITATATKSGYIAGEAQTQITVEPKMLVVNVTAEPNTITSEEQSILTVYVTYDGIPVADANVTLSSDKKGEFSPTAGITDANGNVTFVFTAPPVDEQAHITVTAKVAKLGYAVWQGNITVTAIPGMLIVLVTANPSMIESGATSNITVYVTSNGKPVVNVSVSVTAETGAFSETTRLTDSNGYCTFLFTSPRATAQLTVAINATATKNGYESGGNLTQITVKPETGGGLPLITILLILIPVIAIVIVAVLIKLKIINIGSGEEEE